MHTITLPGFSTAGSVQVGSAIYGTELDRTYVQIAVDYGNRVTETFFHRQASRSAMVAYYLHG